MRKPINLALTAAAGGAFLIGQMALAQGSTSGQGSTSQGMGSTSQSPTNGTESTGTSGSSRSDRSSGGGNATVTKGSSSSSTDQKFIENAAAGSQAEIKLAQLAEQKSSDSKVKNIANQLSSDHTKALDALRPIAQNKGVNISDQLNSKDQSEYDRLSKLSGTSFDQAYLRYMARDHRKDVAEFRKEAKSGKDPEVKSYASQYLPALESHLQMAENAAQQESGADGNMRHHRGMMGTDNGNGTGTQDYPNRQGYPNGGNNPNGGTSPTSPSQTPNRNPY